MIDDNELITLNEASLKYGFSTDRIWVRIKRLGIKPVIEGKGPRGNYYALSDIERAVDLIPKDYVFKRFDGFTPEQVERYMEGEQMQILIKESGFSPAVVYRYYDKHPLPKIDMSNRVSAPTLAEELGIGLDALRNIRQKLDIPMRYMHDGSSSTFFTLDEAERVREHHREHSRKKKTKDSQEEKVNTFSFEDETKIK